ncbi:mannosyltransferase OCH1-like enzyme [Algoriphagus iocasae]|uniref:Mannosyltransferase OCH1-like enzyme n=1 Tax=Algoriphagus iocasae TaxID=1836499 RepID=A0A841MQE6_9BACT|nr:glycosyltransferase [Algoriphagus iocasae]MBB6327819.1 mannosyltransferase OCH1-like enzyme [Algoriphagus iocasae]
MIPKIIHYCWFGGKELGELESRCLRSWKEKMPDFSIKQWDESSIDLDKFPFAKEALKLRKYAFASDVVRLMALYVEGGIYLDTDVLVLKSFENLLNNSFFTGEYKPGALNAAIIGSVPNHLVLQQLLDYYQNLEFSQVNPKTIPEVFDEILLNTKIDNIKIYPQDFFYPLPLDQKEKEYSKFLTRNSYCVHLWNHSWIDEFMLLKQFRFGKSVILNFRHISLAPSIYLTFSHQTRYFKEFYIRLKSFLYIKIYGYKKN